MNKKPKPKVPVKFSLSQIESIPGQLGFIVCHKTKIVHCTIPEKENPIQIAVNGLNLASKASGPEFEGHMPISITVQFDKFLLDMFQAGPYFVIVKKKVEDSGDS